MKKQKVIIVLTNCFPFDKGEPYLYSELPFLYNNFDKVIFFPLNPSDSLTDNLDKRITIVKQPREFRKSKLTLDTLFIYIKELRYILKLPKPFYSLRYYYAFLRHKERLSAYIICDVKLKELLVNSDVVIYSYWFNELAIIASFIKRSFPKVRTVSRAHGFDVFEEQNKNHYIPFRTFKFTFIDKILSVSKKGEKYLKSKEPKSEMKISTSYLGTIGVQPQIFSYDSVFTIATCSIIRNVKRLHLMVDILQNTKFEIVWHVLGNGPDENNLKVLCEKLPSNIKVIFHGYLKRNELLNFYNNNFINLFCSLSSSEGLPVSMMEAISCGVPIMSTDVGGCNEICNEHTGFLIDKDFDPIDVAKKIEKFKNSQANTEEFRKTVREFWEENFSSQKNYNRFVSELLI